MIKRKKVVWYNCTKRNIKLVVSDPEGDVTATKEGETTSSRYKVVKELPIRQRVHFIRKHVGGFVQVSEVDGVSVVDVNPIVDISINIFNLPGLNVNTQKGGLDDPDVVYLVMEKDHAEFLRGRWCNSMLNVHTRATKTLVVVVDETCRLIPTKRRMLVDEWDLYSRVVRFCEFNYISKGRF